VVWAMNAVAWSRGVSLTLCHAEATPMNELRSCLVRVATLGGPNAQSPISRGS